MKVRTLVARHPGGAITPKNDWRLYAENTMAPLRRKSGGAITPKTKWLLYAGNSQLLQCAKRNSKRLPATADTKMSVSLFSTVAIDTHTRGSLDGASRPRARDFR
jgi:hypothetical protein